MNKQIDIDFDTIAEAFPAQRSRGFARLKRKPLRAIGLKRLFRGGRIDDAGRAPRYFLLFLLGVAAIWAPVAAYLSLAPKTYSAGATLILPGAGSNASVNLSDIGQASSSAASPFSSSAVSPTVTYKSLLGSDRVRAAAATILNVSFGEVPPPRVKLTDQTSLIRFDLKHGDPNRASVVANALLKAFLTELDQLRTDELERRENGFRSAIAAYKSSVEKTRAEITRVKTETGLLSVTQYERLVEDSDAMEIRVRDLDAAVAQKRRALEALTSSLSLTPETAAKFLRLSSDPEFRLLAAAMAEASAEAAAARATYGQKHPTRIAIEQRLSGARSKAHARASAVTGVAVEDVAAQVDFSGEGERGALMAEMVRIKSESDGLEAELSILSAELEASRTKVRGLVGPASRLDDLERDYQVAEAVLASALARTDTSKTDIFASYPLVQVLERPTTPSTPSSPHVMLAIAGGAAATMMLLVALILGWLRRPLIDRLISRPDA